MTHHQAGEMSGEGTIKAQLPLRSEREIRIDRIACLIKKLANSK